MKILKSDCKPLDYKELTQNPSWALSIVESANDAIITIDSAERILLFNRRAEEMFLCRTDEAIGQSIDRFLPERFRERHRNQVADFGQTGVSTRSMGTARRVSGMRANGEEFPIEASISQVEINQQKLFTVIMRDLTARQHAEEGRAYLATIVESSDDAIISKNLDGLITSWNKGAEQLYGYTAAEAIGQSISMLIPTERSQELSEILEKLKRGERVRRFETIRKRKDGSYLNVSISVSPIGNAEGQIIGASTVARDITERKRYEQQIIEQAKLLDLVPAFVRDQGDKITLWTSGARRLYGFSSEEAIGRIPQELLKTEFPEPLDQIRTELRTNGKWEGELVHTSRDGRRITVASQWTLRKNDGAPPDALEVHTDLTEQKNIESQLLRAQRIESIGTLAGGIAHDLNNILAPIVLAVDMLGLEVKSTAGRQFLSVLSTNAQRGSEIVQQVLSFARGVDGQRLSVQPVHVVKEVARVLKETFPKSIAIRTNLANDIRAISADPTQLHQLLMNLCINSRDAMPNGGMLTIALENSTIDESYARMNLESRAGDYVRISVADSGIGIDPAIADRIFEPFFTTKAPGKGTGLGLSTGSTIVKSHGGFFNVYSEPGRGTEVTVYLPASKTTAQKVETRPAELRMGNGELILVVDDEEAIRQITKTALEGFGYRVLLAADGTEAIGIYADNKAEVSVVITDMMMPFMDGATTIRALKKMNPAVKVISTSGLGNKVKEAEVAAAGVQRFLSKPYTTEQLLKTLAEVIALHSD